MGGRVDGKTKKKSVKANVTSKFGSKRKTSRMGKKVKKGEMGPSTEFVTRSAALKKLQITLKDFRRLCILKGVYPRVPVKAPKGSDKVYYDIKDISFIMHEPLLNKFREFKSFMKKIRKASGRNQFEEARRKDELKPKFTLDHLVKERYPRFIDALRDLDDALCMIHLFAALPSEGRITPEKTAACSELTRHWQYYISKSRCLHKVFVSVKGVYYQAEIMGEPINWLVPHQFTQSLPREVDIRVMLTFLEFYETFMKFVLYKLYHSHGMQYPPKIDQHLNGEGCFLLAVKSANLVETDNSAEQVKSNQVTEIAETKPNVNAAQTAQTQASAARIASLSQVYQKMDKTDPADDEDDEEMGLALSEPLQAAFGVIQSIDAENDDGIEDTDRETFASSSEDPRTRLFAKLVFFINREVPLEWLQFCTVSFGGKVGWEGPLSPFKADDPRITHQVVDRPNLKQSAGREYVQPQWVFDSINAQMLLPVQNYTPGSKLPPHLSPFVNDEKEGYLPRYREEIRKLQQAAGVSLVVPGADKKSESDSEEDAADDEEEEYEKEVRSERAGSAKNQPVSKVGKSANAVDSESEEGGDDSDDEEEAKKALVSQQTANGKKGPKGVVFAPKASNANEEEEANDLSKIMMSKKTKRLYGRMQHSIQKKQDGIDVLETKRKISETTTAAKATPNKKTTADKKKGK